MSQRGVLGSPREARSCIWPCVRRNTRSTPSTRSCSSCYDGARSSIVCSARSSTASSEPPWPHGLAQASCTSPPTPPGSLPPPPRGRRCPLPRHRCLELPPVLHPPPVQGAPAAPQEGAFCLPRCLWASASGAGPGDVLWKTVELIKPWCVCTLWALRWEPVAAPVLPSPQSRCGQRTSLAAGLNGLSDLHLPLGLLGEAFTFWAPRA